MFIVEREINGTWYYWGTYETRARAEEVIKMFWAELNTIARIIEK